MTAEALPQVAPDAAQLAADLAALTRCQAPGCDAPGAGPSCCCGEHFGHGGRQRARDTEQVLLADPERDWYTADEAARRLRMFPAAIRSKIERGELPGKRVGRHWRIPKLAVEELRKVQRGRRLQTMPTREETAARRQEVRALQQQGLSAPKIAEELRVDKSTIYTDFKMLGLQPPGNRRQPHRLSPDEIARLPELYDTGCTLVEIGAQFDVSPGQVRDHLDRLGVQRRPAYRQSEHPPARERACEKCGKLFKPRFPAADPRFHNAACANVWQAEHAEAALKARGLRSVSDTAQEIELSEARVYGLIDTGLLTSELLSYPGMRRTIHGITDAEIKRYLRDRGRGGDGRRTIWVNPDHVIAHADAVGKTTRMIRNGNTRSEAHDLIVIQTERRRRTLARHQKGRRPATGENADHVRWLDRYTHHLADLAEELGPEQDRAERLAALERRRGTDRERVGDRVERLELKVSITKRALDRTAEEDWNEHPEAGWSRDKYPAIHSGDLDPKSLPGASERVRKGINALQTARKKITSR
jgi:excisionase family DNA binding protein